jgi:hypothetical protein
MVVKVFKIVLMLLLCTPFYVMSQNDLHLNLDYHYSVGISERGDLYNIDRHDSKMYGNSLRLSAVYSFSKKFDSGIGVGADRCENPGYNTFPIFGILRYFPFSQNHNPYVYTNVGYAINTSNSNPGAMWDLGVGYQKMLRKHFGLKMELGYSLKNIKGDLLMEGTTIGSVSQTRNSLSMGLGLIF